MANGERVAVKSTMRKNADRRAVPAGVYSYTVLFEPAEEGGYVVTCPTLPGLVTEGDRERRVRWRKMQSHSTSKVFETTASRFRPISGFAASRSKRSSSRH